MVSQASRAARPIIAAIGNFDGVHRGHQALLDAAAARAAAIDGVLGAVVFDPHPRMYFRPDDPPFLLTSPEMRDALLRAHGATEIFSAAFDAALAAMTPQQFVEDVLRDRFGLAGVLTGPEFRFGAGRAGDAATLARLCADVGMTADTVDLLATGDSAEKIGSSGVRAALKAGDPKAAAAMLGRPWRVVGTVAEGRKLGRTIGFPTANVLLGD